MDNSKEAASDVRNTRTSTGNKAKAKVSSNYTGMSNGTRNENNLGTVLSGKSVDKHDTIEGSLKKREC